MSTKSFVFVVVFFREIKRVTALILVNIVPSWAIEGHKLASVHR